MLDKLRLVTDGKRTYMELAGKTIGKGVTDIRFVHNAEGKVVRLRLEIDLEEFEFLPDGAFGSVCSTMGMPHDGDDLSYEETCRRQVLARNGKEECRGV